MCGRYSIGTKPDVLAAVFKLASMPLFQPRYNVAPTQLVPVIRADSAGAARIDFLKWGFIPSWADDPAIGSGMINARAETAAEKPAFRKAFRAQRCIIPADAFYEWKKVGTRKQPYAVRPKHGPIFALAGLWDSWHNKREVNSQPIDSFTVLTTEPNELVRELHNRMPAMLEPTDFHRWLDPNFDDVDVLQSMLKPASTESMQIYPVTTRINRVEHDGPECLEPIALEAQPQEHQQQTLF